MKKILILTTLILNTLFLTGCQQFAPKAEYTIENCTTHFYWDDEKKMNRITHETCTRSTANSNREVADFKLDSNQQKGTFNVQAGSLTNANETAWARAMGELLSDPQVVATGLKALLSLANPTPTLTK